jgi:membrane-bound ClpP family serine protease
MLQEYSMRVTLGILLILYGVGLLVWSLHTHMKKRTVDKILLVCGIILIILGVFTILLKSLI